MEELKTKEPDETLSILQNEDNIKNDISLSKDETQKKSSITLFDEEQKAPLETLEETPIELVEIKTEDANTTNCLALTIQEDHKLVAFKNVFLRSIRMSWKVAVSTITLALIKLFS